MSNFVTYDDEYFATRPVQLLAVTKWLRDYPQIKQEFDASNVLEQIEASNPNLPTDPLFSAILGIQKDDQEALQRLLAYVGQKGGFHAFLEKPVYLLSLGYALFVYSTQILKLEIGGQDNSWVDILVKNLNAGQYTVQIIRQNLQLSQSILNEWKTMALYEENLMRDEGLIILFIKGKM